MLEGQAITTRPVAAVSEEDYNYLMSHPDHRIHKKSYSRATISATSSRSRVKNSTNSS